MEAFLEFSSFLKKHTRNCAMPWTESFDELARAERDAAIWGAMVEGHHRANQRLPPLWPPAHDAARAARRFVHEMVSAQDSRLIVRFTDIWAPDFSFFVDYCRDFAQTKTEFQD